MLKTSIQINGKESSFVDTTKFSTLSCSEAHTLMDCRIDLSSAAYAIYKIRQTTDIEIVRLVYFCYFNSITSYGILLWGNSTDIQGIFVLQKRALFNFKDIGIMTVASQFIFENLV